MKDFTDFRDILDFAIKNEQEAVEFYTGLASMTKSEEMKKVFIGFAGEEMSHKAKLADIKSSGIAPAVMEKISDLKISDYLVTTEVSPRMSYRDALIVAMNREKAAFKLYTALANRATSEIIRDLFLLLASEESKHKLCFEIEYDEFVMQEN